MSYICQTYDPAVIRTKKPISSLTRVRELAELAKREMQPGIKYSDDEFNIWLIMCELIEYGEDKRNYYKKLPDKTSQDLHIL